MKQFRFYAHPAALVESEHIGPGTRIWAFAHILKGARIGRDCNLCDHVFVEGGAVVGNRVTVKNGVMIWNGVTVEDDVFIGPAAVFTNDLAPRSARFPAARARYESKRWLVPTRVKRGASIGANATIVCGISIGRCAMIAAGAVVTRNVPDHALVVGVPGEVKGWVSETGARLVFGPDNIATCPDSNTRWRLVRGCRVVRIARGA